MEFGQLRVFATVAENRSFSRAAEALLRTQPAVSIAIRRLEEEVGEPLFDRSAKPLTLTEAGVVLLGYANRLLHIHDEATSDIAQLRGLFRGRLAIGANESVSLYLLPPLLLAFRDAHPAIRIEVSRSTSERIPAEVFERNLDFGFVSYEPGNPALESRVVRRDHMVLVVGPSHPLAGRTRVSVRELGAEAFIAHNVKTPARTGIVDFFASHETPLNISMEIATLETIKAFVERGVGVSFLPHIVVATDVAKGRLVEVEVDELDLYRIIRIVHRREHTLSPAAHAFLDLVSSGADESPK